ncbi:hypothetical protein [Moraxella marmotae]|uniref:hypothetical protein n=1 Tax=Moraxella marmotae TaxID=3344520 RepID=UPI0035F4BC0C
MPITSVTIAMANKIHGFINLPFYEMVEMAGYFNKKANKKGVFGTNPTKTAINQQKAKLSKEKI